MLRTIMVNGMSIHYDDPSNLHQPGVIIDKKQQTQPELSNEKQEVKDAVSPVSDSGVSNSVVSRKKKSRLTI
jgi:hypothetical protein